MSDNIYLNDPSFAAAPQMVPIDAFLAAWSGFAYLHAVIGLADIE